MSSQKCTSFKLNYDTNYTTRNVIYFISCKKCDKLYVGQTSQHMSKRINSHKFCIINFKDPDFSTRVATHFIADDHSCRDFSFMPIYIVPDDMEWLLKETYWIHKLGTKFPSGINKKWISNVDIMKTYLYNFDPLKPHFYVVKLGFTGVYIIFLISAQKHILWVLVRTALPRRF